MGNCNNLNAISANSLCTALPCLQRCLSCLDSHEAQKSPVRAAGQVGVCTLGRFSRVRLCELTDCGPPGFSVHGILQARILEWVAMPSSRGIFPTQGSKPSVLRLLHCRLGETLGGRHGYPHFTDVEPEAERGEGLPRSRDWGGAD